jgi:hypothetical protein
MFAHGISRKAAPAADAGAFVANPIRRPHTPPVNPPDTERALRRHLRAHNRSVLAASAVSLIFAAAGWAVLYGLGYWVSLFGATIAQGVDAQPPASFHWIFVWSASALLTIALVDAWCFPNERAVDTRPPLEHLMDTILFIPRMTLACGGSLSALVSLPAAERSLAAELLDRLRAGGRMAVQSLPAQIPDERARGKIIEALSVAQLIEMRRADGLTWLFLNPLAPPHFRRAAIEGEPSPGDVDSMRSANPRTGRNLLEAPPAERPDVPSDES